MRYSGGQVYCGKCRAEVDETGRGNDGYFTCGYGGSHRPVTGRPAARANVTRSNRRKPPRSISPKRQVIRQQQREDAREMGRGERELRAIAALNRHLAASEREGQSGVPRG